MVGRPRRRFDDVRYRTELTFNNDFRELELSKYLFFDLDQDTCEKYHQDHIDYVLLLTLCKYKEHYFDKYQYEELVDIIEGYIFAYEADLINVVQLCKKLNLEIVQKWLEPNRKFNQIGVYHDSNK